MRPLKLTIQGFESYRDKTEIDFTKFDENGLFVICGNNGAGKTSIFDAITYALYGKPSGNSRDAEGLYSTKMDVGLMKAELEFEYRGKIYRVMHSLEKWFKVKGKTKGEIGEKSSAELSIPGSPTVVGVDKVKETLPTVFPVTRKQFTQSFMIPQGQFAEILTGKTEARKEIFSSIFGTGRYRKIQENAKSECNEEEKKLEGIKKEYKTEAAKLSWDEAVVGRPVKDFPDAPDMDDEILVFAQKSIDCDDALIAALDKEQAEIKTYVNDAENYMSDKKAIEELNRDFSNKKVDTEKAKNAADAATAKSGAVKALRTEIGALVGQKPTYENLNALEDKKKELEAEVATFKKNLKAIENKKVDNDSKLAEAKKEVASLDGSDKIYDEAVKRHDLVYDAYDKIFNFKDSLDEYNVAVTVRDNAQRARDVAKSEYEDIKTESDDKNKRYFDNIAGVLANDIRSGILTHCPVCGNTTINDELLAKSIPGSPTGAELEDLQKKVEEKSKKLTGCESALSAAEADLKNARNKLDEAAKKYGDSVDYSDLPGLEKGLDKSGKAAVAHKAECDKELDKAQKDLDKYNAAKAKCDALAKADVGLLAQWNEAKNAYDTKKASLDGKTDEIGRLKAGLKFGSLEELETEIGKKTSEADAVEKEINDAKEAYNNAETELAGIKGRIEEVTKRIDANPLKDKTVSRDEVDQKNARDKEIAKEIKTVNGRLSVNKAALNVIKELFGKAKKSIDKIQMMKPVVQSLCGNDDDKTDLETYVLAMYLDKVIDIANVKFMELTDYEFRLERKDKKNKYGGQSGLDISIIDVDTGKPRESKSASGGETYKASLSLAMALPEAVSGVAGGMQFDSIFIDEGVGTLDENSVAEFINLLQEVAKDKLVGVISHVKEVNYAIPDKIEVTKKGGVSSVKIVTK